MQEEKDIKERAESFDKELRAMLAKYELGLIPVAQISAEGKIVASITLVSTRKKEEVKEEVKEESKLENPDA